MGNEGVKLSVLADEFMAENPGVTVNVTPGRLGPGRGQAPDRDRRRPDARRQPDGHRHDGPVRRDRRPRARARQLRPERLLRERLEHEHRRRRPSYGVPWYVETRLLYYRTDIAEKAGITAPPATLGRPQGHGHGDEGEGRRQVRASRSAPRTGRSTCRSCGRTAATSSTTPARSTLNSPQAVEALTFYNSFFDEGLSPKSVPEGFDITPAFVSGTHPMFFSGPWHLGLIKKAGGADFDGKWAIAPDAERRSPPPRSSAAPTSSSTRTARTRTSPGRSSSTCPTPRPRSRGTTTVTVLPAVQAAWDDPAAQGRRERRQVRRAAQGHARPSRPARPGASSSTALNDDAREDDDRRPRSAGRRRRDAAAGRDDRDRS